MSKGFVIDWDRSRRTARPPAPKNTCLYNDSFPKPSLEQVTAVLRHGALAYGEYKYWALVVPAGMSSSWHRCAYCKIRRRLWKSSCGRCKLLASLKMFIHLVLEHLCFDHEEFYQERRPRRTSIAIVVQVARSSTTLDADGLRKRATTISVYSRMTKFQIKYAAFRDERV